MFFFVYFFYICLFWFFSRFNSSFVHIFVCLVRSVNLIVNFMPIVKLFIFWTSCALKTLLGYVKKKTNTRMFTHMRNTTEILKHTYIFNVYYVYLYIYIYVWYLYVVRFVFVAFCCCLDLLYQLIYETSNETTEDYNTTMIIM